MNPYAEWATVAPEGDETVSGLAGALLALADDPSHVRSVKGGRAFLVHPDVAERWTAPESPTPDPKPPTRTRRKRATSTRKDNDS